MVGGKESKSSQHSANPIMSAALLISKTTFGSSVPQLGQAQGGSQMR